MNGVPHGGAMISVGSGMESAPSRSFDPLRAFLARAAIPLWKFRLGVGAAALLGLLVFVLLIPVVLLVALIAVIWLGAARLRLWAAGLRGRIAPDSHGRENVRVLPRDA